MTKKLLVVEDEPGVQELLQLNFSMAGYAVTQAYSVPEALAALARAQPDLIVVDWNMPGGSGLSVIRHVRREPILKSIPVLMLTARDDEQDMISAFDLGADDYLTKPFRVRILLARVQALLRRHQAETQGAVIAIDGLRLLHEQRLVMVAEQRVDLGAIEYQILHLLAKNPMRVFSRMQLLDQVWGGSADIQERTVDAYVGRLRKRIEDAGHHPCIETVRSMGYRFVKRDAVAAQR
jgi:two-component system phosphate regulon response regulator PhoB